MGKCKACGKPIEPNSEHYWDVEYMREGVVVPFRTPIFGGMREFNAMKREPGTYGHKITGEGHL